MSLRAMLPHIGNGRQFSRLEVALFGTLHRQIDRLFDDFARGTTPPAMAGVVRMLPTIDVTETEKAIEITAEMLGLERQDIEITLQDDTLTIKAETMSEAEQTEETLRLAERDYLFHRMIELPAGVDASAVEATMARGVLKIAIPKPARLQAKTIEVKEAADPGGLLVRTWWDRPEFVPHFPARDRKQRPPL